MAPVELPFPAGESPFHMKGLGYQTTLRWVRGRLRKQGRPLRTAFHDPGLVEFFEQRFLASAWYDVFPILALAEAGARLSDTDVPTFVRDLTAEQARNDTRGVYRFLLTLVSPQALARRLPKLTEQYFDFGGVDEESTDEPGQVVVVRRQMPHALVDWYEVAAGAYVREVLGLAGATTAGSRLLATWDDSPLHGLPTTAMRFEFSWHG